jgi:hypothetical protein
MEKAADSLFKLDSQRLMPWAAVGEAGNQALLTHLHTRFSPGFWCMGLVPLEDDGRCYCMPLAMRRDDLALLPDGAKTGFYRDGYLDLGSA